MPRGFLINALSIQNEKKTICDFKKELLEKNPSVELVGDYLGTDCNLH